MMGNETCLVAEHGKLRADIRAHAGALEVALGKLYLGLHEVQRDLVPVGDGRPAHCLDKLGRDGGRIDKAHEGSVEEPPVAKLLVEGDGLW
jgi:hypothetical protein